MSESKKIALIIPRISGGGAERAVQTIGSYYNGKGHTVYYFLLENSCLSAYRVVGKVVHLSIDMSQLDIWNIIYSAQVLKDAKRKHGIDIAISFMEEANFLNSISKGREKTILSVRTPLSFRNDLKGLLYDRRWIRLLYNRSDRIVTVSRFVGIDLIRKYGIRKSKVCVVPNPALMQGEAGEFERWAYGEKAIVCVGRMEPVKQQDRLIRAFSYVRDNCPEARLIIVGDGKLRRYLERICREHNLDESVTFVGFSNNPGAYVKNARVFVLTSQAEGFPNAMVEAMAFGVPIVTTDSPGGCGEIVGKKSNSTHIQMCQYGILTPHIRGRVEINAPLVEEEIQLGKALLMIINNDDMYKEYSNRSKQRAEYYSIDNVMGKWNLVLGLK